MKLFSKFLIVLLLLIPVALRGQNYGDHIVADSTATNRYVPIYGYYADNYMRSQTIYPAEMLTQLQGAMVTHMTYYLQTVAGREWNVSFEVRVGVTVASKLNGYDDTTAMRTVFVGGLNGLNPLLTIALDSSFLYMGGNLLVEVRSLNKGSYSDVYFYGVQSDSSSWQGRNSSSVANIAGSAQHFIPKTNFYSFNASCVAPSTVNVLKVASFRASLSWLVSNTASAYLVECGGRSFHVTDTTIVIESLSPNTDYQVSLRSLCSNGDTSDAVNCNFHTYCAPFVVSDTTSYTEDFEAGLGDCWSNFHLDGPGSSLWNISNTLRHSGVSSACLPDQYSLTRTMLVSQPIVIPSANDYQLSFWVYKVSFIPQSYLSRTEEGIRVWANTTPDTIGATEIYYYHRNSDVVDVDAFSQCEALIPRADTLFLIFEGISQFSGPLYIDDIEVTTATTCPRPTALVSHGALSSRVSVSWTDDAGLSWKLRYRARNTEDWIYDNAVINQRNYTLQGLDPLTDYELQVRGICSIGDTSGWSNSLFFTTACSAIEETDLPYSDDFEAYASGINAGINSCWRKSSNSSTAYPYPTSLAAVSGERGLYFYAFHPSEEGQTSIYSYAAMPPLSDAIDLRRLSLSFLLRRYETTSYNFTTRMQVGLMSNPLDPTTFVSLYDIDLYSAAADSVVSVTIDFSTIPQLNTPSAQQLMMNHRFLAFYCPVPQLYGGTLCHNYSSVDDVNLYISPSCYPPDSVSFSNISSSSVMLHYNPQGEATVVRYRPVFDTIWTYLDTIFDNSTVQQISNLEPATRYYVQLQSLCSVDSLMVASQYSDSFSFVTLYGIPYEENFTSQTIPSVWTNYTTRPDVPTGPWVKSTLLGNSIKSNVYSSGSFSIVSPTIDLASDSNACLTFQLALTDFNLASAPGVGEPDSDDHFYLLLSTDGGEHWRDTISWGLGVGYDYDFSQFDNNFTSIVVPLRNYAHGTVTIAFCTESGVVDADFDVHVAHVLVYAPSPCPRPSQMRVYGVSDHGAMLHWNADAQSQLRYRPFGTSTWTTIDSGFNYQSSIVDYQLNDLLPATQYSVQVRSICPPDTMSAAPIPSDWVDFPQFTTLCVAENLPYQPEIGNAIPDCWQIATAQYLPDTLIELQPTTSGWNVSQRLFSQNHFSINIYGASCRYWAVSPLLTITHQSQISFDAALTAFGGVGRPSSVGGDDRFLVLATFDDGLTWQTIATFDSTSQSTNPSVCQLSSLSNSARHFDIPIPFPSNQQLGNSQHTVRIALYAESSVLNADNDLHLDNILFSRVILPEDTLQLMVADAELAGYPLNNVLYTVAGIADTGNYAAIVTFTLPASQHINGVGPFTPIFGSSQLFQSATPLQLLKSSIHQISKSDTAINLDAYLIDVDTLCYHFNFHYTIPFVTVSLFTDTSQGVIASDRLASRSSQFSARLGDTIILAAVPRTATCYCFVAWGDGDTSDVRQVFLVSDTSFTATFGSTLVYDVDTVGEACNSYVWFDSLYTFSGSYTYQSQPLNGCDSVATLDLTIHYDSFDTIVDAVCDSLYWLLADTTIFQSGGYDFHLTNGFGCDSSVTLQLTVNSSVIDSVAIEISNAELPYTYNNIVLDTFGVYPFHFSTVEGCDSLVVFSLRHLLQINNSTTQQSGVLTVSPNPTQGRLAVLHPQFGYCELYDLSGRKLLYSREAEIDLSQLPAAVYTLRIVTSQGTYLRKVVKLER